MSHISVTLSFRKEGVSNYGNFPYNKSFAHSALLHSIEGGVLIGI